MNRKEEQRRCKVTSMFVVDTLWKNYTIFMSRSFKYNFSNTRKNNFSNTNFAERENKSTRKLISPKINLVSRTMSELSQLSQQNVMVLQNLAIFLKWQDLSFSLKQHLEAFTSISSNTVFGRYCFKCSTCISTCVTPKS